MAAAIMDAVGALIGYDVGSSSPPDGGIPFSVYMWNSFIALLVFLIVRISPDKR
ncbi:hypothetical protein GQ42DRAFT_162226 [Ramicandelaber brevisporus]|nr:hypothetical protein GQ42DRAFT_162226 [Ramicandelaber brevisporus]